MKTLKLTLATMALLFVGIAANAAVKTASNNPTKSDVVNIYIDAITKGKTQDLDQVLDRDMKFDMKRGNRVNALTKISLLDYLQNNWVATEPVTTKTTVMQDDDNSEKVKIDFNYGDYERTDVVSLYHSAGWVITNVTSTYE